VSDSVTSEPVLETHDVEAVNRKGDRQPMYAKRIKIYPKRIKGLFRSLKWWIMGITLAVYYITPWLRWDRGSGAPDQAVLIDIPGRRFYFFFIEIWPQEIYYLTGLLIMAALGLFLVTAAVGRAWCGYACPQTVWVDLFIWVERFVEGDRAARIRLDKSKFSISKLLKRTAKYVIWMIIAMATGGAWIFYFADAPTLMVDLFTLNAPMIAYSTVAVLAFTTFTLGGFMREQVCTYMCPWPRIQAAMMDEESLTVTYRENRGEPRMPFKRGDDWSGRGDCIDCNACVVVCPQGIDIRDGQQLECITCALCIDACNDVMDKIGRPRDLISYANLANDARVARGEPKRLRLVRTRTVLYFLLWSAIGLFMVYNLITRADLDLSVLRDRNPLFVQTEDGIRNGYELKIINKSHDARTFVLSLDGIDGARMKVIGQSESDALVQAAAFSVPPDQLRSYRVLVFAPNESLDSDSERIDFVLAPIDYGIKPVRYTSVFRGPDQ